MKQLLVKKMKVIYKLNMPAKLMNEISEHTTNQNIEFQITDQFLDQILNSTDIVFLYRVLNNIQINTRDGIYSLNWEQNQDHGQEDHQNIQQINYQRESVYAQFIPVFIQLIERNITNQLTKYAQNCLLNIIKRLKPQSKFLIEYGSMDIFLKLLFFNDQGVRNQAIQGLYYFIQLNQKNLKYLLQQGLVKKLLQSKRKITNKSMMLHLISLIPEDPPQPDLIPIFSQFILKYPCKEEDQQLLRLLIRATWGLENIIANGFYDELLEINGLLERLTSFLKCNTFLLVQPAIMILYFVSQGNMRQRQELLDAGCHKFFQYLLEKWLLKPNMIMFIPKFLEGYFIENNSQQIGIIMKEINFIKLLIQMNMVKDNYIKDFYKKSIIVLSMALVVCNEQEILILLKLGVFNVFYMRIYFYFDVEEAKAIVQALDKLFNKNIKSTKRWIQQLIDHQIDWLSPFLECTSENLQSYYELSFVQLYLSQRQYQFVEQKNLSVKQNV